MAIEFSYNQGAEYKFAEIVGDSNPIHQDVELKVTQVLVDDRRLILDTNIFNSDGKVCLTGSATVWLRA